MNVHMTSVVPLSLVGGCVFVRGEIDVVEGDTREFASIKDAVGGCSSLVICTGTTAFPTLAWRNGNTPRAVDEHGVINTIQAFRASCDEHGVTPKRIVLMSSIGVSKRKGGVECVGMWDVVRGRLSLCVTVGCGMCWLVPLVVHWGSHRVSVLRAECRRRP